MTAPTDAAVLRRFDADVALQPVEIKQGAYAALLSTLGIYGALFATGAALMGNYAAAAGLVVATALALYLTVYWFNRAAAVRTGAAVAAR